MLLGHEVTVLDNFFTGSRTTVRLLFFWRNRSEREEGPKLIFQVSHWVGHPNFEMVRHDVVEPFLIEVDRKFAALWIQCI